MLFKKISIIGGAGFLGTYLCRELTKKKLNFEIIDLKPSKEFASYSKIGDIRDYNSLKKNITGKKINSVEVLVKVASDNQNQKKSY